MTDLILYFAIGAVGFISVVMLLNWLFIYVTAKVVKNAMKDKE